MVGSFNFMRIIGDLSHLSAKCILIWAIHRNRSAEGVSLITQALYTLVFLTRYLDIFSEKYAWNRFFKIFYILSSIYTMVVMQWWFPRSREREAAWKIGAAVLAGSLVLSPFVMMIFESVWGLLHWLWVFSQILESVSVLPQLLLLRQTTVPTVIDSFYLVCLGSYRAFYLVSWIVREADINSRNPDATSVIFGVIQTALYVDFAWVYYTRQRVKLRNGGIVDADDIRRGWILGRIFGKASENAHDDEEGAPSLGNNTGGGARPNRSKWGARGISISADEGIMDTERANARDAEDNEGLGSDARMKDPDELARVLDDEDGNDAPLPGSHTDPNGAPSGVQNGSEWRDT